MTGVRVTAFIEHSLPLANHAQAFVIDNRDLDRNIVKRARHQLLIGHLETTIAINRPDCGIGASPPWRPSQRELHTPSCQDRQSSTRYAAFQT